MNFCAKTLLSFFDRTWCRNPDVFRWAGIVFLVWWQDTYLAFDHRTRICRTLCGKKSAERSSASTKLGIIRSRYQILTKENVSVTMAKMICSRQVVETEVSRDPARLSIGFWNVCYEAYGSFEGEPYAFLFLETVGGKYDGQLFCIKFDRSAPGGMYDNGGNDNG